jgi:hypothetical protein
MSGSWYEHLADTWQDSKIDGLGYLNPQEIAEDVMKNDSRAVESVAKKWNMPWLEQEAHGNVSDPAKGMGKASTAAGLGFLGAWLGGAGGALGGGGEAAGAAGTMESALMNTGYTPSSLSNLMQYGQGSGNFGQAAMNYGGSLMSKGGNQAAKRYAMDRGMEMMNPPQQQQPRPQPLQYQQDPLQNPYGQQDPNLTEEQKMQLRMMGYSV